MKNPKPRSQYFWQKIMSTPSVCYGAKRQTVMHHFRREAASRRSVTAQPCTQRVSQGQFPTRVVNTYNHNSYSTNYRSRTTVCITEDKPTPDFAHMLRLPRPKKDNFLPNNYKSGSPSTVPRTPFQRPQRQQPICRPVLLIVRRVNFPKSHACNN